MKFKIKKAMKIVLVFVILTQVLTACSTNTSNYIYSSATQNVRFSAEGKNLCFYIPNAKAIFLESDSGIINLSEYSYLDDFYSMRNPYLCNNKLYYITTSRNNSNSIACININDLKNAKVLTPEKSNIICFTVVENTVYYYAYDNEKSAIYSFNLITNREKEILSTNDYIYNFYVSDNCIIYGNRKYDFSEKQSKYLTENFKDKDVYGIGIIDNVYYFGYENEIISKEEIYSINLKDNSVNKVCELPIGYNKPRLYDNKILYVIHNEKDSNYLSLGYYDLSTNEEKIAFDKTEGSYFYSRLNDYIDNYDSFYYAGDFYMWYPDTVVKINSKNEDTVFGLITYETSKNSFRHEYNWLTYQEYLEGIK